MIQSCEATMSQKRALTGSPSSEASIKATLQQDRTDNHSHEGEPKDYNTYISYISELQQKFIYYKTCSEFNR